MHGSHVRTDDMMVVDLGVFLLVLRDRSACTSFARAVSRLNVHTRGVERERESRTRAINYRKFANLIQPSTLIAGQRPALDIHSSI